MRTVLLSISGSLTVLALICSTAVAQTTAGLEPGVHADPGSPAAKEYALPLNQARQTGGESHSSSPTLFGAGIKPPPSGGTHGPDSGSHASGAAAKSSTLGVSGSSAASASVPPALLRAARTQDSSGGNGSLLALLGGGVAILVLGGFGGTVLRHNRHPTPSG
jgi:hypothetical protein